MILGAEIAMLIMGLVALFRGKLTLSKKKVVLGTPARVLGVVAMLPIPISLCLAFLIAFILVLQGSTMTEDALQGYGIAIEAAVVILTVVVVYTIGGQYAVNPEEEQRRLEGWDPRGFEEYTQDRVDHREGIQEPGRLPHGRYDDRIRD